MLKVMRYFALILLPAFLLGACAQIAVKQVDYAPALLVPENAEPAPIKFSRLRFLLPPGAEIGMESGVMGTPLGRFCSWENYPVSRRAFNQRFQPEETRDVFTQALEANGYDVVDSIDVDFRRADELERADYAVSARVIDVDVDMCQGGADALGSLLGSAPGVRGKIYVEIDWSVYDILRRKVVYKTTTQGYSKRPHPNLEGLELLFYGAFDMAAHNLAAEETFYNLIVRDKKPANNWRKKRGEAIDDKGPRLYDARETVDLPDTPLSLQPLSKNIERARSAAILIQKAGHGSGFFITKDGHILTNQHVVGNAKRVRIVTKRKEHEMIAEVLRVDKVRDVALLKLEEIPETFNIVTLPIRTEKLKVSEDIYAIGAPVDYRALQDSVTKGIVSAHRFYKDEGVRLPFIQGDVKTHKGNSGGALLDKHGNIVGLSTKGRHVPKTSYGVGLGLFIPISEALRALDITIGGKDIPHYEIFPDEEIDEDVQAPRENPAIGL